MFSFYKTRFKKGLRNIKLIQFESAFAPLCENYLQYVCVVGWHKTRYSQRVGHQ